VQNQTILEMKFISELFTEIAQQQDNKIAVTCRRKTATYAQLEHRSNMLSQMLQAQRAAGKKIAVILEPSIEAVIAMLAIFKIGATYLPIDPLSPAPWQDKCLSVCNATVVITEDRFLVGRRAAMASRILVDEIQWDDVDSLKISAVDMTDKYAACILCAGSDITTLSGESLLQRCQVLQEKPQLKVEDVLELNCSSPSYDCTRGLEALPLLLVGGSVIISDTEQAHSTDLAQRATIARLTPSGLVTLVNADQTKMLRAVVCCGEPLMKSLVEEFQRKLSNVELHYCYFPPETARETTWHVCTRTETKSFIPIGKPVQGSSVYVLDKRGRIAPIGMTGEIHLGNTRETHDDKGPAVGPMPVSALKHTADRGRWLSNGELELVPSPDAAWIGGMRAKFGEIEDILRTCPAVVDCAVRVKQTRTGQFQLIGYIVLDGSSSIDALRQDVRSVLPSSLTPSHYVLLSRLPLTTSGVPDEAALARIEVVDSNTIHQAEEQLRRLWAVEECAVLETERIGTRPPLNLAALLPVIGRTDQEKKSSSEVPESECSTVPALSIGAPLAISIPGTLAEVLEKAATHHGHRGTTFLNPDGSTDFQSYSDLLPQARRIASGLRRLGLCPGDKVIFQIDDNRTFVTAFWGCVLCGCVSVPISIAPTYKEENGVIRKLGNAWEMLGHPVVMTSAGLLSPLQELTKLMALPGIQIVSAADLLDCEDDGRSHTARPEDPVLVLLTSGSTGMPKGVVLHHRNILHRCAATSLMNFFTERDVSLNWLPLDHVGGIVMFHIRDVYLGCEQIQATTEAFLSRPLNWLNWVDEWRVSITWAPNFAYALVNGLHEEVAQGKWDLSSLRFILNAGEAIVPETACRFLEILSPHGLPATAMHPAWGMSETSSAVTYSDAFRPERINDPSPFVAVGHPVPGIAIRIVNNENQLLPEGQIGRLQVKGATVTEGYYQNPGLNQEVFTEDGWFATGDLGIIRNGALTITGREKDTIIINGVNYYSHEIEGITEQVLGVERSYAAACAVRDPGGQTDMLAVFFVPVNPDENQFGNLVDEIRNAILRGIGINSNYLIPVTREAIPKTAIGKIQRSDLRKRFEAGEFESILKKVEALSGRGETVRDWFFNNAWLPRDPVSASGKELPTTALVFMDQRGLGQALSETFPETWIKVSSGPAFSKNSRNTYRMNFSAPDQYRHLLTAISEDGFEIDAVLHLSPYDGTAEPITDVNALRRAQEQGFYSVLLTAQALMKYGNHNALNFYVVTRQSQPGLDRDVVCWENGTLGGLLRSIPQEAPWIYCHHLDLDGEIENDAASFLREMYSTQRESQVAYRQGKRFVARLSQVDWENELKSPAEIPLKYGGLYLITGGLGGIGTMLARFLIEHYDAKLILNGRTLIDVEKGADQEKNKFLQQRLENYKSLERLKKNFIYRSADISDEQRLQSIISEAESLWGRNLDGVFHLAGEGNLEEHWTIFQKRSIAEETIEGIEKMFRTKVYGSWAISRMLDKRPNAILVAFSSINGVFGGSNFSSYSAANSFQQTFFQMLSQVRRSRVWCFSWTLWDNIGMSAGNPQFAVDMAAANGFSIIEKSQGLNSILLGLCSRHSHLIVGLDSNNRNIRKHLADGEMRQLKMVAFGVMHPDKRNERIPGAIHLQDSFGVEIECEFSSLTAMPRTIEGQVDIQALLYANAESATVTTGVAPRNQIESSIAGIWQQLLGTKAVSITDNFFKLGGHSLLAVQLISRIRELLSVEISLRTLFEAPTVAGLAQAVEHASHNEASLKPISRSSRMQPIPLSYEQQRLWFLAQLNPESGFYNIPGGLRMKGKLNEEALRRSLDEVLRRHESLRTRFVEFEGEPAQIIENQVLINFPLIDLSGPEEQDGEAAVELHAREEADLPFNLQSAPLMRARLLRLGKQEHVVLFTIHHIIADGWSMGVLLREIAALYASYSEGERSSLVELPIQYADYAIWQRAQMHDGLLEKELSFWRDQLKNPAVLELPVDRPRSAIQSFRGAREQVNLDPEIVSGLRWLAELESATLFMVLLSAFQLLLERYSGNQDILIGSPVSGRTRSETEPLIGLLVNTLIFRTQLDARLTVRELLAVVRENCLKVFAHQNVPFERLVEELRPERDLSRNPLFQVMFALQNTTFAETISLPHMEILPLAIRNDTAKFDLSLLLEQWGENVGGAMEYSTDILEGATVAHMVQHFYRVLRWMVANPENPVSGLMLLEEAEVRQITVEWNQTETIWPARYVHELIEAQVRRFPYELAMIYQGHELTYAGMNAYASKLARYLKIQGAGPESRVGIYMERSPEMVIGVLAILKAGAAYVPIDISYPRERRNWVIKDSKVSIVLSLAKWKSDIQGGEFKTIFLDEEEREIQTNSSEGLENKSLADNIAYVIYTSGSTGTPKGVELTHAGFANYIQHCLKTYGVKPGGRTLVHSSLAFDLSITSVFAPLAGGGTLVLVPEAESLDGLARIMNSGGAYNLLKITPAHLEILRQQLATDTHLQIDAIVVGGEQLATATVEAWKEMLPETRIINEYGPTETVVGCSVHEAGAERNVNVPIGRPISNMQLYVLDLEMQPVPVGVVGELYIGGVGLARGYGNRPGLTAEKFVPNPFSSKIGERLYKTGDLVRYMANGSIAFLGRNDDQVKIRGYRIELGEIEGVLRQHPAIRDVAILADTGREKRLLAFIVPNSAVKVIDTEQLKTYLYEKLPPYLIPAAFFLTEKISVTANGKVDRAALLALADKQNHERMHTYVAPRDTAEQTLAQIWEEVLGIRQAGVHDNFFDLGGESLKLVRVQTLIRDRLQHQLSMVELFQFPTIDALATRLRAGQVASQVATDQQHISNLQQGRQNLLLKMKQRLTAKATGLD
jgi:surfactin family lipopeptide synthetase A